MEQPSQVWPGLGWPGWDAAAPGPGANLLLSHNLRQLIGSCLPSSRKKGEHWTCSTFHWHCGQRGFLASNYLSPPLFVPPISRSLSLSVWLWLICKASQASSATSHHRSCRQHATSNRNGGPHCLSSVIWTGVAIDVAVGASKLELQGYVNLDKRQQ